MTNLAKNNGTNKRYDFNSTKNQSIKSRFVEREVLCCASYLMDNVFKAGELNNNREIELPTYEDVTNFWQYPEYNGTYANFECGTEDEKNTEIARLEDLISEYDDTDISEQIQNEIDELNDLESEPAEIYEWWIVTNWLAEKLEIQGQCILEYANMHFWGRQTTGQAILLDRVISRICEGMEILEGQPNEWKNV